MDRHTRRRILDYSWATLLVAVATALSLLLGRYSASRQSGFLGPFLLAVAFAAWRGGFVVAMYAVVLSTLIVMWNLPPPRSFRIDKPDDVLRLVVFVVVAVIIGSLQTARDRMRKRLTESEQRLGFALDSSGVGCWDADVRQGTFWSSPNLCELFGRSQREFATTYEGFFAYIYPEDRDFFRLASVQGGLTSRNYEISHRIICADGSVRRVHTRGKMYLDNEGKIERMVGAVYGLERIKDEAATPPGPQPAAGLTGLTGAAAAKDRPPGMLSDPSMSVNRGEAGESDSGSAPHGD